MTPERAAYQARHEWKLACLSRGFCRRACETHHPCELLPERELTGDDLDWLRAERKAATTARHLRVLGLEQSAQAAEALADLIRTEGGSE